MTNKMKDSDVNLEFRNQVTGSNGPVKFSITVSSSYTIQQVKEEVSVMINPKREVRELSLTFKGKPLEENMKTMKQVIGTLPTDGRPSIMFLSSKSPTELEYQDLADAAMGGNLG